MDTRPIICTWPCVSSLSPSPPPKKDAVPVSSPAKTSAQAISSDYDFSRSQLPKPCINGDSVSIKISEDEYQVGLASCKNNLHGRILLPEGNQPIGSKDLQDRLQLLWRPADHWRVTPLGWGFYEFYFASSTDLRRVWAEGSWNLKPGVLRLSRWVKDFNPNIQRQSHAQCWLRIHDLPQEYWRPKILFEIANGIGTPIALDEATKFKEFGHFARVLTEVNLAEHLPNQLLVERDNFSFHIRLDYENLPLFCDFCHTIGHSDSSCHMKKDFQHAKTPKEKQIVQNKGKSVYVAKSSKDPLTNGTVPLEPRHMEIGGPSKFGSNKLIEAQDEAIGAAIKTLVDALVNIDLDHNLHNKKDDDLDSIYDESLHPDSPKAARIDLISKNTNILVDNSAATQLKKNGNPDDIAGSAEFEPDSASVSISDKFP